MLLETRDELAILWLNRPPTNPISPQVIRDLTALWDEIESRDGIRAVVFASSNFAVFCAGADIKEFTKMTDPAAGQGAARRRPRRAASHGAVEQGDCRGRQLAGARRRLRAGDGL